MIPSVRIRPPFNKPIATGAKRKRGPRKKKNVADQQGGLQQILNMQQASIPCFDTLDAKFMQRFCQVWYLYLTDLRRALLG